MSLYRDLLDVRSCLFVPMSQPRLFDRAHERGADAIVLDLEDGVAADQKDRARSRLGATAKALATHGVTVLVRVNAAPELFPVDVAAALEAGAACIVLPKVESASIILELSSVLERAEGSGEACGVGIVALMESAAGVLAARDIARAHSRVVALGFGGEDYCAGLGIPSRHALLEWPAQQVAVAARAAGISAFGLPSSMTDFADEEAFELSAREARMMGFTGCFCIHPSQVRAAGRGFSPSAQEVEDALAIVAALETLGEANTGAFAVAGRMIDAPVVENARRILARSIKDVRL